MKVDDPARFQVWMLLDDTDWVDVRYIILMAHKIGYKDLSGLSFNGRFSWKFISLWDLFLEDLEGRQKAN